MKYESSENIEDWNGLNPIVRTYWIVKGILTMTLLVVCSIFWLSFVISAGAFIALLVLILFISFGLVYIWAVLFFERYFYSVRPDGVYINRGIWFKSERVIPYERVQHITVTRGPMEIIYGIFDINIFTAGTGSMGSSAGSRGMFGAEGFIPGLLDPEPLRQIIWERVKLSKSGSGLGDEVHDEVSRPLDAAGESGVLLNEVRAIRRLMERLLRALETEE